MYTTFSKLSYFTACVSLVSYYCVWCILSGIAITSLGTKELTALIFIVLLHVLSDSLSGWDLIGRLMGLPGFSEYPR